MTTVILLRHADVDPHPAGHAPDDWPLNAAGRKRAKELARVVGHAGVRAIFVSPALRTHQTVEPLAQRLGLTPRMTPDDPEVAAAQILAEAAGGTVLVAGHSNTVPAIIDALGAASPVQAVSGHDDLFVVTVCGPGQAHVVRLKYGVSTAS